MSAGSGISTSHSLLRLDTTELRAMTAFMSAMPGMNLKARNSAMKSIGWELKRRAKQATKTGDGLPQWPEIKNISKMVRVVKAKDKPRPYKSFSREESWQFQDEVLSSRVFEGISLRPWGNLPNLLVYNLDEAESRLFFGFKAGIFGRRVAWVNAPRGVNGQWGTNNQVGSVTKMTVDNFISDKIVNVCKQMTEGYSYSLRSKDEQRYYAALGFIFPMGYVITTPARPLVGPVFTAARGDIVPLFQLKFWSAMRRYTNPKATKLINDWFGETAGGARAMR